MSKLYKGLPVSCGIGRGNVVIIDCSCPEFEIKKIDDSDKELGRFVRALKTYCDNTREQMDLIKRTVNHYEADILQSHINMTHNLALQSELITKVSNGMCAEQALSEVCDGYINSFLDADVDFVRQLATDVKDLKTCITNLLLGVEDVKVEDFGEDSIIIAKELLPSVIARLDRKHTKGIVTEIGSYRSHGAALARAMNIPSVTNITDIDKLFSDGELATVNGDIGIITGG